jgi:cytochrome c553
MTRLSSNTAFRFGLAFLVGLLAMGNAGASGNAAEGAKKAQFCAGCHGPDGNYTHTGTPRLAGQSEAQFIKKMQVYKSGQRLFHPLMAVMTNGLNDQDIADMGAFYAAQKVEPALKPYRLPQ